MFLWKNNIIGIFLCIYWLFIFLFVKYLFKYFPYIIISLFLLLFCKNSFWISVLCLIHFYKYFLSTYGLPFSFPNNFLCSLESKNFLFWLNYIYLCMYICIFVLQFDICVASKKTFPTPTPHRLSVSFQKFYRFRGFFRCVIHLKFIFFLWCEIMVDVYFIANGFPIVQASFIQNIFFPHLIVLEPVSELRSVLYT